MRRKRNPTHSQTLRAVGDRLERALRLKNLDSLRESSFSDKDLFDARRLTALMQRGTFGFDGYRLALRLLPKIEAMGL